MFKFNFSAVGDSIQEAEKSITRYDKQVNRCSELIPESETEDYDFKPISVGNFKFLVRDLENTNKAENASFLNSFKDCDVIPNVYEGGLKVWECTYDLLLFLSENDVDFSNKAVLDLGCGSGLLGIYAAFKNAKNVHFQDYNTEVLQNYTIPNARRNDIQSKTRFFRGDWDSFPVDDSCKQFYDYILCSEVLYNAASYSKLGNLFERTLQTGGKVIMASKSYYFGVGGSVQQFEEFLREMKTFSCQTVWKTGEGNIRIHAAHSTNCVDLLNTLSWYDEVGNTHTSTPTNGFNRNFVFDDTYTIVNLENDS